MSWLTRRERDALVASVTALSLAFLAGFFTGLLGFETASAYEYHLAVFLVLLVAGVYLIYRGVRRAGRFAVGRWQQSSWGSP